MSCCNVLIIDEDADDIFFLLKAFKENVVEHVHSESTIVNAFAFMDKQDVVNLPKMIIIEHYLQGITSDVFLKILRKNPRYSHVPVMLWTCIGLQQVKERYAELGMIDFMLKPNSYSEYMVIANEVKNRLKTYS